MSLSLLQIFYMFFFAFCDDPLNDCKLHEFLLVVTSQLINAVCCVNTERRNAGITFITCIGVVCDRCGVHCDT